MSETFQTPTPRRAGRGLRVALILSVMLNVLVVGVLVGGMMRMSRMDPMIAATDIRALWHALPDDARADLRRVARAQGILGGDVPRADRESRRERAERANARLIDALRADNFDPGAFSAFLSADHEAAQRRLDAAHGALAEQIALLTPAQRRSMAEAFEASLRARGLRR